MKFNQIWLKERSSTQDGQYMKLNKRGTIMHTMFEDTRENTLTDIILDYIYVSFLTVF